MYYYKDEGTRSCGLHNCNKLYVVESTFPARVKEDDSMSTIFMTDFNYYRIYATTLQTDSSSSHQNMPSSRKEKGGSSEFAEMLKSELRVLSDS